MAIEPKNCCIYQLHIRRSCPSKSTDLLRTVFYIRLRHSLGEASPSAHMDETCHDTRKALVRMLEELDEQWPEEPEGAACLLRRRHAMYPSARSAIEMLLYDDAARRRGVPLYRYLNLGNPDGQLTSYPVTLGSEADLEQRIEAARDFPALKVICGEDCQNNLRLLRKVRSAWDKPLRIDGYGAWGPDEAKVMIRELGGMNVEYLEQPLPPHRIEQVAHLRRECPFPILLDEDVQSVGDLEHVAAACDGFTVKLMACGGVTESLRLIRRGRQMGLRVALDMTLESSVAATAAAHLAAEADYVNLGRHLHVDNDPVEGASVANGQLKVSGGPGLDLKIRPEFKDYFP